MANTPQAKKRIRRNANRAEINGARVSRIRTFIKAVESALDSGKKADAAEALKKAQPEMARGVARGVIHKNTAAAEIFAAVQASCLAGLTPCLKKRLPIERAAGRSGGRFRIRDLQKSEQFPRFARVGKFAV